MMVTFVSQCEKNALKKTRRVLDAFANRIGDSTWQTLITEDGLLTVKKMLRQTASRSTAVSCHWIRSRSRSQLLWVVGNKLKFNEQGIVPVNTTIKKIQLLESTWDYLPLIRTLAAVAALLHDWGKATQLFQEKLDHKYKGALGDPIRHEWISCVLLDAFIRNCNDKGLQWLTELAAGNIPEHELKAAVLNTPDKLFGNQDPIAQILMWLIVSHHRLPVPRNESEQNIIKAMAGDTFARCFKQITQSWGYENRQDNSAFNNRVAKCFEFPNGLMSESKPWLKEIKRWVTKLDSLQAQIEQSIENNVIRLVLHHARLCLMLGDHHYSSLPQCTKWQSPIRLFANTDRKTKVLKQKLDEHLVGVKNHALAVANVLPIIQRLEQEDMTAVFDNNRLRKPSTGDFYWQQKAVNRIKEYKNTTPIHGAFIVNMASTGCGKTFANAKIMQALSESGNSLRFVLALGLRTLTLQTGDEYRERVGLKNDELAVLIGSKAVTELHNTTKNAQPISEESNENSKVGSESLESLIDNDIDFTGIIKESTLTTVLKDERACKFLYAPVLVCTIDHMMGATETKRGGRYILPSLRLLSSDLVIDEVDDFTGEDLAAIGRLIHMAGMLGRKVMISSATIPPALTEGFFHAYRLGWQLFSLSQSAVAEVKCIWVDEFNTEIVNVLNTESAIETYITSHATFIKKRVNKLEAQPAKRKADIVTCPFPLQIKPTDNVSNQLHYYGYILQAALDKHQHHHTVDLLSQKQVSFGVIRTANIRLCVDLTRHLLTVDMPEDTDIRVMAYHSQQVLLMRHEQEQHLDAVLKRKESEGEQPKAFSEPIIRKHLASIKAKNVLFILVATPVEEVGRDHDFDWAIVEPSSYRSIIQLAGRVRRHRKGEVLQPNIGLLQYNWNAFTKEDEKGVYFQRPGYENEMSQPLPTHDLSKLIDSELVARRLDAAPRIQAPIKHTENQLFAAIEHKAIKQLLTDYANPSVNNLQGYLQHAWWLTALPQVFQSFRRSKPAVQLFYVFDKKRQSCYWAEKDDEGIPVNQEQRRSIKSTDLPAEQQERLWLSRDYEALLEKWSSAKGTSMFVTSLRYGELSLTIYNDTDAFEYSPQLGMYKI